MLFVGMLTAQVLHGTSTLVLDFGRLLSERAQVVLDVLVLLVHRGAEVVSAGLDLWVLALSWVHNNGVLVMLIGLTISVSYMWWAFRASGFVASQPVSAPEVGTGGTGERQPPPRVHAGGGSASDSDEMPPLEEDPDEEGDHFRVIATDVGRLMPFADDLSKMQF